MRAGAAFALLACAAAGAAFTLTRAATLAREPVPVAAHGMCAPAELLARERLIYPPSICVIELPDDGWRPLRVDVALRAGGGSSTGVGGTDGAGPTTQVSVNDGPPANVAAGDRWTTHQVSAPPRLPTATRITLRIEVPPAAATPDTDPPLQVGRIDVTRELTTMRMLRDGIAGALAGIVLWWLISRSRLPLTPLAPRSPKGAGGIVSVGDSPTRDSPGGLDEPRDSVAARTTTSQRATGPSWSSTRELRDSVAATSWRAGVGLAVALFLYFSVWALLRPPYQTPDEVQHHMRATAVLRHPWVAGVGEWSLDPRYTNPLAVWTPASLDKLFFDTSERLTLGEIAALERIPWPAADARPAPETYRRAIASYPTLYYWPVFVLGEAATRGLHLTPYQSTYAYRLVSAALAAMLWGAVYLVMRRVLSRTNVNGNVSGDVGGDTSRGLAAIVVSFLVLNPMVPFVSSGINPDAVNVPLALLSTLLVWQLISTGTGAGVACLALVATAWTKPSGLQMMPAFAVAVGALWIFGQVTLERLRLAAAAIAGAAAIAWCGFYAWSPPRFVGGPPVVDRWTTYLGMRWQELPWTWQTYWGTLGWLEYSAPVSWYWALAALTAISLICVILRASTPRLFAAYAAIFLVAFLAVTLAGEFLYLPTAGYFLQGRHLLPASLGLAGLMWHRVRPVRLAFLAVLIALNVLLLHQTALRYYTRGWTAVAAALPFGR